jgi:hypothetical protein
MNDLRLVLATIQAPTVEVRDSAGELIGRVNHATAMELVEQGYAKPVGKRALKYLRLREDAPWTPQRKSWNGASRTTRRVRSDGILGCYQPGQRLGWELEHKKVYE